MQSEYRTKVIVPPTAEPVSLAEARAHLRDPATVDNALIELYISAARTWCEEYVSGAFMVQTIRQDMGHLPNDVFLLARNPVQSIESIEYFDEDDVLQTLSTDLYNLDSVGSSARVIRQWDEAWPSTSRRGDAVQVTYIAGYPVGSPADDPQNVPATIRAAVLLVLGDLYENRENTLVGTSAIELPIAAKMLLQPYRQMRF